jgi:hypothetical protein
MARDLSSIGAIWYAPRHGFGKLDGDTDDAVVLAATIQHAHEGVVDVVGRHGAMALVFAGWVDGDFDLLQLVEAKLAIVEAREAVIENG